MTTVAPLAQTLQAVLTTTADAAARRSGFVQRRSKRADGRTGGRADGRTGAAFVQALVCGWLANP